MLALAFSYCKEPDLYYTDNYESQVVVDGSIEYNAPAMVFLTMSSSYFGIIDSVNLLKQIITTAKVTVSDGETEEILTLVKDYDYFPPYFYKTTLLKGETDKVYTLKVIHNGNIITAQTTIPNPVSLDTFYFEPKPDNASLGNIVVEFTDNGNEENYYRFFTLDYSEVPRFIPTYFPLNDDKMFNGQRFRKKIFKGNKSMLNREDDLFFVSGKTINVKIATLDKASFNFWNDIQSEFFNSSNPFGSSNAVVRSNINGGIGVWCGYGSLNYSVVLQ